MLRRALLRLGGGEKSSFADKRRVIHPLNTSPTVPGSFIKKAFTDDAMKETYKPTLSSGGALEREALNVPERLEGERSRTALEKVTDPEFDSLISFITGAQYDQMITGRRFQQAYDSLSEKDDVIVWLCMIAMSVLNPGDVQSRLMYKHLEALADAVANGEMAQRTAFRFYESAVRSPAFREIARRQQKSGTSARLAGICAAAEAMNRLGICRRPMTAYFELYQRITERSEAMMPWGFPPMFQFESRLHLEDRLRFFHRLNDPSKRQMKGRKTRVARWSPGRIAWMPPTYKSNVKWPGPRWHMMHTIIPD